MMPGLALPPALGSIWRQRGFVRWRKACHWRVQRKQVFRRYLIRVVDFGASARTARTHAICSLWFGDSRGIGHAGFRLWVDNLWTKSLINRPNLVHHEKLLFLF
jgi:hypothetical protein